MIRLHLVIIVLFITVSHIFGQTYYIDPVNGDINNSGSKDAPWSTLQDVVTNNMIESYMYTPLPYSNASKLVVKNQGAAVHSGDTLILLDGMHGEFVLQNYNNTTDIVVMAGEGHEPIIQRILLQGCSNWKITGLTVSAEPYGSYSNEYLVNLESHAHQGPTKLIEIDSCNIYSTESPWTAASDWLSKAGSGIFVGGDSINVYGNIITNIKFGLTLHGDYGNAVDNDIVNFSGDAARILGSNNLFENNLIKNCYDVDENHDDGIQSYTTNGIVADNNIVRGNIILNYEDPNQPLLGDLQGIGCFDGFYNNWIVENNLVVVNHWHGITFLGARDFKIVNNTVLDPTPQVQPGGAWIMIADHKNGSPSTGCTVKNNVANKFTIPGSFSGNKVLNSKFQYGQNFVDYSANDFHLLSKSSLINKADNSLAPAVDIEGVSRPQGDGSDIGCYEYKDYQTSAGIFETHKNIDIIPNPVTDKFQLVAKRELMDYNIEIIDLNGSVLQKANFDINGSFVNISSLHSGIYFVRIEDKSNDSFLIKKIVKQ